MVDSKLQEVAESLYRSLVINSTVVPSEFQLEHGMTQQQYQAAEEKLICLGLALKSTNNKTILLTKIDLINLEAIQEQLLDSQIKTPLYYLFSTDSTNEQAKQNNGEVVFIADHQKAGYGRNARQWISPLGQSVALSIKHKFDLKLHQLSGLNIAVGVAIMSTLKLFNQHQLGLKWPNDIIGSDGKVAGILIEATGNSKQSIEVVIGIGINWNISPQQFEAVKQDCMNAGIQAKYRTDFIAQLIIQLNKVFNEFTDKQLSKIKTDWHKHDIYLNQTIQLIHGSSIRYGKYLGIDSTGALLLQNNGKIESIINGEVSLRPIAKVD